MAGLLDFLNTADGQMGLGLLAAAGPRSDGAGFGQRLMEGVGAGDAWRAKQQHAAMQKMQIDNYASEIENRKLATIKDARMQTLIEQMFGGSSGPASGESPGAGMASGAGMSGLNPASAGAAPTGSAGGGIMTIAKQLGLPPEAIQSDMVFNGGKKISEMLASRSEPKWQNVNGNLINTNAQGFTGGLQGGMNASANGQVTAWQPDGKGGLVVGAPAGALDTARAYGQVSADQKPIKVFNPNTNREEYSTEGNVIRPQAAQPGVTGSGYNGGSRDGANAESIRIIQSEMNNPNLSPQDKAAMSREIQRMQAQSGTTSGAMAAGPSATELARNEALKTSAVDTAKADVVRDTSKQTSGKMYGQMTAGVDRAMELLNSKPTESGIGAAFDSAQGYLGGSNKGADTASKLEALSGWLTANVPRMEGPQSDKDVANYRIMAGMVGDRTKPVSQRLAAAQEVKSLQDKYASLNGYGGDKTSESKAPEQMASLPTANSSNKGRTIKDTVTGETFISNGMQWKKGN